MRPARATPPRPYSAVVPDLFATELADAFRLPGCPLCRTVAADEERWIESFWREGKSGRDARLAFYDAGGFCPRHGWLLHRQVAAANAGAAIADLYGSLARRDLELLDRAIAVLTKSRRRTRRLTRRSECPACVAAAEALSRKAYFLLDLLRTGAARELYGASDGLCLRHLAAVADEASDDQAETVAFLLADGGSRLAEVRTQLEEFDRKRDVHFAHEAKGAEQDSWTEVIRRYVGEARA